MNNLKKSALSVYMLLQECGIDIIKLYRAPSGFLAYVMRLLVFKHQHKPGRNDNLVYSPRIHDIRESAGAYSDVYCQTDLFISQYLNSQFELKHCSILDIGSRIDGLVAHIASSTMVKIIDVRPMTCIPNIKPYRIDLSSRSESLDDFLLIEGCQDVITSNHAIEHFGLGRYGDSIDANGHKLALELISKLLKETGTFIFGVPVSPTDIIYYDCHRSFKITTWITILVNANFLVEAIFLRFGDDWPIQVPIQQLSDPHIYGTRVNHVIFILKKQKQN